MMQLMRPRTGGAARLALAVALAAGTVTAQTPERDPRLAQSLFEEGRRFMLQGDFERACPMFAQSHALDPGGGALLNLALCHEAQGKLATAWVEYNEGLSLAIREERKERVDLARARIDALRARLPTLVVVVPSDMPFDVAIDVDGRRIAPVAYGVATPIDPGPHRIVASAPRRTPWSASVQASLGKQTEVRIPPLEPSALTTTTTPTRLAPAFYVASGVAVVSLATAVVTGVVAIDAEQDARAKCVESRQYCPDATAGDDASRARTFAWVSTAALGGAIVAAAVAVLWPRERVPVDSVRIAPTATGAFLVGHF